MEKTRLLILSFYLSRFLSPFFGLTPPPNKAYVIKAYTSLNQGLCKAHKSPCRTWL